MRTLRLALAGLLAGLGLVALTAAPSHACSCVMSTTAGHLDGADAAFTGTLVEIEMPPERRIMSSTDPVTYHFDVDRDFKGDVPDQVEVVSARFGASCGLERMKVDADYLVFAYREDDELHASLCGGTEHVKNAPVDRVAQLTGDPVRSVVESILAFFGVALP